MTRIGLPSPRSPRWVGGPGVGVGGTSVSVGRGADDGGTIEAADVAASLDGNNIRVGGRTSVVLEGDVAVGRRG